MGEACYTTPSQHYPPDKKMQLEDAQKIVDAAKQDSVELELREEYSGRGMYGRTTVGIVGSIAEIGYYAGVSKVQINSFRWDNMGKNNHILY